MMRKVVPPLALAAALAAPLTARAADRYVSRPLTLPRLDAAFDVGLGIGHSPFFRGDVGGYDTGPGLNLEGAVGLTSNLELGFRTGLRLNPGARFGRADQFGRLFGSTETFDTGVDTLANPELRITGRLLDAEVAEIGLEGRIYLPFEAGTAFGAAFGAPFLFHFGRIVRFDTGAYLVTVFYSQINPVVSIPARVWFQVTDRLWLGPISALQHVFANVPTDTFFTIGFGLGYQFTHWLDFKTQFLFPAINEPRGNDYFGFGAGVQMRIE